MIQLSQWLARVERVGNGPEAVVAAAAAHRAAVRQAAARRVKRNVLPATGARKTNELDVLAV